MAIIRRKEIAGMNLSDLQKRLGDLRFELLKANAQRSGKTSPRKIKEIKKTIARMLTSINKHSREIIVRNADTKTKSMSGANKLNKDKGKEK